MSKQLKTILCILELMAKFAPFKNSSPGNELRLVLIGKTGVGKSRTGNSIIGDKKKSFEYGCDMSSMTYRCSWKTTVRFGRKLDVVDTPGVFDTERTNFDVQKEIIQCIALTAPGPHALLFCVRMGRFTDEDLQTIRHFLKYFGEELLKYTIVVFTQVDQWEADAEEQDKGPVTVEQYINNLPQPLKNFLALCGNRYLFVNNRLTGRKQEDMVRQMIVKIDSLSLENNKNWYSNADYQMVEKALEEEARRSQKSRDEVQTSSLFYEIISGLIKTVVHNFYPF